MTSLPPRRFILLGDADLPSLLQHALRQSEAHSLAAAREALTADPEVPGERIDWDAAIFRSDDAPVLDLVRELARHGSPLVFDADRLLPPEVVAELSLLDAEGAARIVPHFDWRAQPLLQTLQHSAASGELGALLEITIDRCWSPDVTGGGSIPNDLAEGFTLLADIDAVRLLGGDYSQVTVLRSGAGEAGMLQQTLRLAGGDLPPATVTYRFAEDTDWLCRVVGSAGSASLRHHDGGYRLDVDRAATLTTDDRLPDPVLALQLLDASLSAEPGGTQWSDLVRFYEIQAAMQQSLRRRRTIDLHFETASERSQFKTHMATIGCGVILWTMFGILGLLFAGAVLDPRDRMQRDAEAAGFVIYDHEFAPAEAALTETGRAHVTGIAGRMDLIETVVYIESTGSPETGDRLDDERRREVWSVLSGSGADDPSRVVVRPLRGQWFARFMNVARFLVFAPVGLFLVVQILLLVTKPAASRAAPPPL